MELDMKLICKVCYIVSNVVNRGLWKTADR